MCYLTRWRGKSAQRIHVSNHGIRFKYATILLVNYTSVKLGWGGGGTLPELPLYSFVIKCWGILERF